uniref:KN motif and ankyrin repeat domain-containing protein 1 n=1 Tax=Ascaris suum TaxID=6253 RepID=F1KS99_ASCSU
MSSLKGRPSQAKCNCCPYGFHIDLDFVKFVENVANGNSSQQHSKRIRRTPKELPMSCNRTSATSPHPRNIMSPMESIFSDSLENIVSDFEETFNPSRDYCSDRENVLRFEQASRINGYLSDFGPQVNRCQPSRVNHYGMFTAKKPPVAPSSTTPPQSYCTALGRTLSEIKAKKREELEMEGRRSAGATTFRKQHEFTWPQEFGPKNGYESERSSYEQGKTHYLGSKTPDMCRKTFSTSIYQTASESSPQWRRQPVPVQKSSSTVDMDGFASMRRKKADDGNSESESTKPLSAYVEWRKRQQADSPPSVPYGSLPLGRQLESLKMQGRQSSPNQFFVDQPSAISNRRSTSTGTDVDSRSFESKMISEPRRSVSSVSTSTPPVPPAKPCSDCPSLKEQLSDLSVRLAAVEMLSVAKKCEEKSEGTEAVQLRNVGVNASGPEKSDRGVGRSRPVTLEFGTITSPVQKADFASDAPLIEYANKETDVSRSDLMIANWARDASSSPPPPIQCYSVGLGTESFKSPTKTQLCDATTLTILDVEALLAIQRTETPNKECITIACSTEPLITKENGCYAHAITQECATLTGPWRSQTVSRYVGPDQAIMMLDADSMTVPVDRRTWHMQTDPVSTRSVFTATTVVETVEEGVETVKSDTIDSCTACDDLWHKSSTATASTQTDAAAISDVDSVSACSQTVATQTEFEPEPSEPRVLSDSEIAESLWLMPSRDTTDVAVGNDEDTVDDMSKENRRYVARTVFEHSLIQSSTDADDEDKVSFIGETLSDPEAIGFGESAEESPMRQRCADTAAGEMATAQPRALGHARAAIVKKLLTEKSPQPQSSFIRGTVASKSCRIDSNKGDPLQYITDQHKTQNGSLPSTPQTPKGALREKVILKKEIVTPLSRVPEPIPARIPRPKIAKYNPGEAQAQSPDEEAEVADRLTPLRSEMRTLRTHSNGRLVMRSPPQASPVRTQNASYDNPAVEEDSSSCSSDSEGSYDTNEAKADSTPQPFEMSEPLKEALEALQKNIDNPGSVEAATMEWATKFVQHEWLKTAARRTASATQVEGFVDALEAFSPKLLGTVVNMTDQNENTSLHYAVSHGNFDVVSVLLDSRICCLDRANKAGYTPVMLAALCEVNDEIESAVIHRLFQLGNVNAKAVQHGQTALMLAVSHGKINTTRLLLQCNADLNIQDEEGSTALMCAAEHGHKEIVKLLLAQPDIDASLSDCDSSTALSIAVENGHRDIGVLIYAHLNYGRNEQSHHDGNSSTSVH